MALIGRGQKVKLSIDGMGHDKKVKFRLCGMGCGQKVVIKSQF
jgi:hypothetical protein